MKVHLCIIHPDHACRSGAFLSFSKVKEKEKQEKQRMVKLDHQMIWLDSISDSFQIWQSKRSRNRNWWDLLLPYGLGKHETAWRRGEDNDKIKFLTFIGPLPWLIWVLFDKRLFSSLSTKFFAYIHYFSRYGLPALKAQHIYTYIESLSSLSSLKFVKSVKSGETVESVESVESVKSVRSAKSVKSGKYQVWQVC